MLDIPLLFEGRRAGSGGASAMHFDVTIVVWVPRETQIERQLLREGYDRDEAERRIDAQMPLDEKRALADFVIDNSGSLAETERRLNELQQQKDEGQQFILSPEQQAEIRSFNEKRIEMSRKLKEERKNLRREVDRLERRLTWINIGAMPLLVTFGGIGLAFWKRKHTGAK